MVSLIDRTVCTPVLLRLLFLWIEWFVNETTVVAFKCFDSVSVVKLMFVCVLVIIVRALFVLLMIAVGVFWTRGLLISIISIVNCNHLHFLKRIVEGMYSY